MMVSKLVFFPCAAHNTRVVWAWTWASRNAQMTSPNPHHHAAAELHTVQTHCHPVHGSVSLTRTHAHAHTSSPKAQHHFFYLHSFSCLILLMLLTGSSNNVHYRTERIKIPSTPRYPRSMLGSDRGTVPAGKIQSTHQMIVKIWLLKSLRSNSEGAEFQTFYFIYFVCLYFFQCLLYYCWAWLVQCFL